MNQPETKRIESKQKRGEMVVVCSSKGGVGKTVIAVNLAIALK